MFFYWFCFRLRYISEEEIHNVYSKANSFSRWVDYVSACLLGLGEMNPLKLVLEITHLRWLIFIRAIFLFYPWACIWNQTICFIRKSLSDCFHFYNNNNNLVLWHCQSVIVKCHHVALTKCNANSKCKSCQPNKLIFAPVPAPDSFIHMPESGNMTAV